MNCILLIGAGFSRNWGGWLANEAFEYLLGNSEIIGNDDLRNLLWKHQAEGGFEDALAEIQGKYFPGQPVFRPFEPLQRAIQQMFKDMNRGFFEIDDIEFQQNSDASIKSFLMKFEAIFTLNQDLLLERHYLKDSFQSVPGSKWVGAQFPCMRTVRYEYPDELTGIRQSTGSDNPNWAHRIWRIHHANIDDSYIRPEYQPCFKLHGSLRWEDPMDFQLLVMGRGKADQINSSRILNWYHKKFDGYLTQPNSRLMIIGYGFRDKHINAAIKRAVDLSDLKVFVIDPRGSGLAKVENEIPQIKNIQESSLEDTFKKGLIGASRRTLKEIFGGDSVELRKIKSFFNN